MSADVLSGVLPEPEALGEPVVGQPLDDALGLLEDAAREATAVGGWSSCDPLRLAKASIGWLVRCPRRAVASSDVTVGDPDLSPLAVGLVVDAGAKLATLSPRQPVGLDDALAFLAATGDDTVDRHLGLLDPAAAAELRDDAADRLERLLAIWPAIDPAWWPRVEEPARVRLADGAVILSGRLDVLLGGPPTDRPGLVIEVKSGRWHDAVRADAHIYGLLVGLRDGCAPSAVLTMAAGDGATQLEPIRPAVLQHGAERIAVALRTAARLAAGEPPPAYPGSHCTFCPLRAECPEARAAAA